MPIFQYHPDIIAKFPHIVGGVIVAPVVNNAPTPDALKQAYLAEQQATLARLGATPLSEIPSLAAWRGVFRGFGVDPTQYRSAAEALLRRLTKQGDIPSINTLVDLGNLVSIRYALPVAIFDWRDVTAGVTVRLADGTERFTTLGQSEPEHPERGEVIFVDQVRLVSARRWCWRQSAHSAAREDTTSIVITAEAHHEQARTAVTAALRDLTLLLVDYAGVDAAGITNAILDARVPSVGD